MDAVLTGELALIVGYYVIQPWLFHAFLVGGRPLAWRIAYVLSFCVTLYVLAERFRQSLLARGLYTFNIALLWWIFALLVVKILHAVLDPNMARFFGVDSFYRLALFCWLPATPHFNAAADARDENTRSSLQPQHPSALFYVGRGILQGGVLMTMAQTILNYDLQHAWPTWLHSILGFYMVALSMGGFADLIYNAPARLIVGPSVRLLEPADAPALSISLRSLWMRWSKSPGLHFRYMLYEPHGGHARQWTATLWTFWPNGLLHIFWWSPVSLGRINYNWMWLLMVAPVLGLATDKAINYAFARQYRWLLYGAHYISGLTMMVYLFPLFLNAQGLPENLADLARLQLGQI